MMPFSLLESVVAWQLLIDHLSDAIIFQICVEQLFKKSHWLIVDIGDLLSINRKLQAIGCVIRLVAFSLLLRVWGNFLHCTRIVFCWFSFHGSAFRTADGTTYRNPALRLPKDEVNDILTKASDWIFLMDEEHTFRSFSPRNSRDWQTTWYHHLLKCNQERHHYRVDSQSQSEETLLMQMPWRNVNMKTW